MEDAHFLQRVFSKYHGLSSPTDWNPKCLKCVKSVQRWNIESPRRNCLSDSDIIW